MPQLGTPGGRDPSAAIVATVREEMARGGFNFLNGQMDKAKRMGLYPPVKRLILGPDGKPAKLWFTPEALHMAVEHVARPAYARFAMPPNPYEDARHPDFSRVVDGNVVASSDAAIDGILDCILRVVEDFDSFDLPPGTRDPELENLLKTTVLNGEDLSWFITKQGPGANDHRPVEDRDPTRPPPLPEGFEEVAMMLAEKYVQAVAQQGWAVLNQEMMSPPPSTTNPGYPTWWSSLLGRAASSCFANLDSDTNDAMARALRFQRAHGLPLNAALAGALSGRAGTLGKFIPMLVRSSKGWFAEEEWKGGRQRNRVVQMMPLAVQILILLFWALLHAARRQLPGLYHAKDSPGQPRLYGMPFRYEADTSGLDMSVSPDMQDVKLAAFERALKRAGAPQRLLASAKAWRWAETLPLLTPAWNLSKALMAVVKFDGAVRSGLKTTSEEDTFLIATVDTLAMKEQEFDWRAWPSAEDNVNKYQGDDVSKGTSREMDKAAYTDTFKRCGLVVKLHGGGGAEKRYTFLMTHDDPEAGHSGLLARASQNGAFPEDPPVGKHAPGKQVLGARGRLGRISPIMRATPYADRIWEVYRMFEWVQKLGLDSARTMEEGIALLTTSAKANEAAEGYLKSREGARDLASSSRSAGWSPSAQALMEVAASLGHKPDVAADLYVHRWTLNLAGEQPTVKDRIASELFRAFTNRSGVRGARAGRSLILGLFDRYGPNDASIPLELLEDDENSANETQTAQSGGTYKEDA